MIPRNTGLPQATNTVSDPQGLFSWRSRGLTDAETPVSARLTARQPRSPSWTRSPKEEIDTPTTKHASDSATIPDDGTLRHLHPALPRQNIAPETVARSAGRRHHSLVVPAEHVPAPEEQWKAGKRVQLSCPGWPRSPPEVLTDPARAFMRLLEARRPPSDINPVSAESAPGNDLKVNVSALRKTGSGPQRPLSCGHTT